jgi:hypothetical protein
MRAAAVQLARQAARSAAAGSRWWHAGFQPGGWAALAGRVERRAVAEVPYYRERWAAAGGGAPALAAVSIVDLAGQVERLCPLARPWRPDREPALWGGGLGALRTALALTGGLDTGVPVLEVRRSLVEARRLGPGGGPPYAVLLADDADVASPARRAALEIPAAALAAQAGAALVVGPPGQLPAAMARLRQAVDDPHLPILEVHRLTAQAAASTPAELDRLVVLHDPYLGYFGAAVPSCGAYHLDWTRYHARPAAGGLALTALWQRRPTLVAVTPVEPGFTAVARCPRHRSPILVR